MDALFRSRSRTRLVRSALVVLLLALAGLLATTVADETAPGAAVGQVSVQAEATGELLGGPGDPSRAPHGDETVSLLCLCALLVAGFLLAARRGPVFRVARAWAMPRCAHPGPRWTTARPAPSDPLDWGVSRT